MNAVEIESALSDLAAGPFDPAEFPFQFLAAFDKKETTLKRLRKGDSNKSDTPGAVLLLNNIHLGTCAAGETRQTLERLKTSPKTASSRAKFVFATDGSYFEAEDLTGAQEPVADDLRNLANYFGFFLALAGISTVREIKDNPIDVRATGRLNKLYIELLRLNPEWGTEARRHDMNHFMARLIFCFFGEDTDIFHSRGLFTGTVEQMSQPDGSNTDQVLEALFSAMNVKIADRAAEGVPNYANQFPYVNGGLFAGSTAVPHFSRIAKRFEKDASVETGDFFLLGGQTVYVATVGEPFRTPNGERDGRLRVIYSNGTESNILLRSLQRALYKDENGRRLTKPDLGPLFGDQMEADDLPCGTIYAARSLSKQPEIVVLGESLLKIGVTGGSVEQRVRDAENDPTFLFAPVEVVASWQLANVRRFKLENTIHRVFAGAQLQMHVPDRFGLPVQPKEWFLIPLPVLDQVIARIRDESITDYVYDPALGRLRRA